MPTSAAITPPTNEETKMAKRNEVCSKTTDPKAGTIRFEFADGTVRVFDVAKIPTGSDADLNSRVHGPSQKLGDSYAGCEGSVTDAIAWYDEVAAALYAGTWTTRVAGEPKIGLFAEALARVKGWTVEDARKVIDGLPEDKKKGYRGHPKIKVAMAEIQMERAKKAAADAPELDL